VADEPDIEVHMFSAPPGTIQSVWVYLIVDGDGEGMVAAPIEGMTLPLFAVDQEHAELLRPYAIKMAKVSNRPIKLVRFDARVELDTIGP
jgi:hypothetical protein